MDFTGLLTKYKLNRPLTDFEKSQHLLPSRKSLSEPDPHLGVISMNSTYLEIVDKYFLSKGFITTWGGVGLLVCFYGVLFWYFVPGKSIAAVDASRTTSTLAFLMALTLVLLILAWVLIKKIILKEVGRYTHYPIRFNRANRKVYVFRLDGSVMVEDWDKIYFTVSDCDTGWEVRAYRLAMDGQTVLEAFALPFVGTFDEEETKPKLWSQWEFIRQYMEEGPENLNDMIRVVQDVATTKESYFAGLSVLVRSTSEVSRFLGLITLPVTFLSSLGRWVAMRTCKIPRWPNMIDSDNMVRTSDPFLVTLSNDK